MDAFVVDASTYTFRVDGVEAKSDPDGRPVLDKASGLRKVAVYLTVRRDGRARPDQWTVTVAGEPKIAVDSYVTLSGLVAYPWEQNGRHGIALRAESIQQTNRPVEPAKAS
jgi:hypothetical protein